jgi:membrane-associated phospholipid phosphatase
MFGLINKYRLSFLVHLLILLAGLMLVMSVPKLELHLILNSNHTEFQDRLFRMITLLGNGWIGVIISAALLLVRMRYFLMMILSLSFSGLMAQFLKHMIFPGLQRPSAFLEKMPDLALVTGIDLHSAFSFPSGHTTTAFAVLLLVGLICGKGWAFLGSVLLAWMVAFSRVYLSQHFLADVLSGAVLGTLSALFFYWYFGKLKPGWLDRPIWKVFPASGN